MLDGGWDGRRNSQIVLDAMRELSDADLAKLIKEISDYSWAKAQATLRLIMEEKENRK